VRATSTRALACWKVWQMSSATQWLVLRPILTGPLRASGESNVWAGMKERAPRRTRTKELDGIRRVHII